MKRNANKLRWGGPLLAVLLLLFCIVGIAAADEWVGGLPLTTVQTGTVTGDLWMDIDPAPNWGDKDVTKTFTLPAAAVAEPGRIKWARLYISAYCGHMQNDYAFTMTTSFDGDGIAGYEHVWPETAHEQYYFATDPETWEPLGNDNSEFPGHGTGEPYLMLNDHETRVTSDYFAYYDVTDLITSQEVTVNVNTVGSFDGRIKVMSLVVAYDDPSSTTETIYWVNEGHDVCSYYVEDYFGYAAVGETSFATTGLVLNESDTATLYIDYMASNNGRYGFPTSENDFEVLGSYQVSGSYTNYPLDRDPDVQGAYSGVDSWDVKDYIDGSSDVTFAYSRHFGQSGTAAYYKIPLAFLVVKKPMAVTPPTAAFVGDVVTGTVPLMVQFTDQSTNYPTEWLWDFGDGNTSTEQNPVHEYTAPGTYTVTLTVTNSAGSDDETKVNYIMVEGPSEKPDLVVTAIEPNVGAGAYMFANEPNVISVTVKNDGGLDVAASTVSVVVGNDTYTAAVPAITAGGSQTVTVTDTVSRTFASGPVSVTATADYEGVIDESDETNNEMTSTLPIYYNGYKGKRYTDGSDIVTYKSFSLRGNVLYSTGDSVYFGGSSTPWTTYTTNWTGSDLLVPTTATVEEARLYVIYTWDKNNNMPDDMSLTFNSEAQTLAAHYTDRKNFGTSNYPYGMLAYDVTEDFSTTSNVAILTNAEPLAGNPSIRGMLLVVIYKDGTETQKQIIINEEFDLLYGGPTSGTTPEEATAYATFGALDTSSIGSATLITFAPGAGPSEGDLLYNGEVIATNVWNFAGTSQIGVDSREVTSLLSVSANDIGFQSSADYMEASNAILMVEYPDEGPSITVESPNGGEKWTLGSAQSITWSYTGNSDQRVKIEALRGGSIVATIPNVPIGSGGSGSFNLRVPSRTPVGDDYLFRVTSTSNPALTDVSDAPFSIIPPLTVISPNGGEEWEQGTTQTIQWNYTGDPGPTVKIEALRGDTVLAVISHGTPVGTEGTGSLKLKLPMNAPLGTDFRIRISSTGNAMYTDTSDAPFSIVPNTSASITLDTPNGGEKYVQGSTQTIQWHYTGDPGSTVKIEALRGDAVLATVASSYPIGSNGTGSYDLTFPYNTPLGSDYRIRVTSNSNPAWTDTSDAPFTVSPAITVISPNGGSYTIGSILPMGWTYAGYPGETVKIDVFKGGRILKTLTGVPIGSGGSGWYNVTIPANTPIGDDYQIRVSSTAYPACTDTSDGMFAIG